MKGQLGEMMARHARAGRLEWIGVRAARRASVVSASRVFVDKDGLAGDHASGGKKAVTVIQQEHLPVIEALSNATPIRPEMLRRNLVLSGMNLYALRKSRLRIGQVVLLIEGPCPPCSRMEEELGPGGYNAMRGHGGWYASVIQPGELCQGDDNAPL